MGKIIYPNFTDWEKHTIRTRTGITFAPEDFFIDYEFGRRAYFNWHEATAFEEKVLSPNGWRLPTLSELKKLEEYNYDFEQVGLKPHGYVSNHMMRAYRSLLSQNDSICVVDAGIHGYYWTSTSKTGSTAHVLTFGNSRLTKDMPSMGVYTKDFGYNIRCVKKD